MSGSTLLRIGTCIAIPWVLAHCGHAEPPSCGPADPSCAAAGGTGFTSGGSTNGGTLGSGGSQTGTSSGAGGTATGGGMTAAGGSSGESPGAGGTTTGGASSMGGVAPSGGSSPTAGTSPTGGSDGGTPSGGAPVMGGAGGESAMGGGPDATGGTSQGGTDSGGGAASGGMDSTGGMDSGGSGPVVDQNGVPLAKPGDSKSGSREYLNLGDIRLINNKWGSDELGCNTMMRVFVNQDKSFGWAFDRGGCGGNKTKPDYPEIEFGIHPFGANSPLATTPSFPSTSVLPLQIKDITSASVTIDGLSVSIQRATTWNVNFEFWLSREHPVTSQNPGVYAELIAFWGWQDDWACDKSGTANAGDKSYNLCHQDDNWAGGQWRYFQFRANGGPMNGFSGRVDVKAFIDWLVGNYNLSRDLWVTRLEVGTEIDDNTAGSVTLRNITFEVNGVSKSPQFAE
ncbi:MAG: hypothetical protein DIU78_018300 [Pseudomonadota bacterium]